MAEPLTPEEDDLTSEVEVPWWLSALIGFSFPIALGLLIAEVL